ncbi:GNAT family N-acetyltransferase [Tsuneonella sp. HG222]
MSAGIETERLILRNWRDEDFAALHALCTCPQVMATIGPLHDEERTRALLGRFQAIAADNGFTLWAMERKADGRVIGFCGALPGSVPQLEGKLEIGWRMMADCWGQGYAREAAQATLGYLAKHHPDEEIWAITARRNTRSQGLMKRLGMTYRPTLDFAHPRVEDGSPLKPHVTYWLEHA